jgi:predicted heme/steroid binding protein
MSASSSPPASDCDAGGPASARVFTRTPGQPILISYKGRVYDVSGLFLWMTGQHFWLHAGRDLTGRLTEAPHGEEMLQRATWVGTLAADTATTL